MKVKCVQNPAPIEPTEGVAYSLFHRPQHDGVGRVAVSMPRDLRRAGVEVSTRAWDFLAVALSVAAADQGCIRNTSPDGWTRDIQLELAITDPDFWDTQKLEIESALRFLTGDIWRLAFVPGNVPPPRRSPNTHSRLCGDCVCLLSGGLDSLVGAIDTVVAGRRPVLVSQVSKGDAKRQRNFAMTVGKSLSHLQLRHAIKTPGVAERSQRARSLVFLAYGVLAASVLPEHRSGQEVELLIPENGFISLNIPLTPLRLGSLSTRTTHPLFLQQIQSILDSTGFHVRLSNPYQFKTKGEMLVECTNQRILRHLVFQSTSCSRFARFNYKHCGRCFPCLVRRASLLHWGLNDETPYEYEDLSLDSIHHKDFDDVRSAVFAALRVAQAGVYAWAGDALNYMQLGDTEPYAELATRGIAELHSFLNEVGAS